MSTPFLPSVAAAVRRAGLLILALSTMLMILSLPKVHASAAASLALTPASGLPGVEVVASGTELGRWLSGTLTFDGAPVATFKTTNRGAFSVRFSVPTGPARAVPVKAATAAGSASATFTVLSAPAPAPVTDPVAVVPPAGGYFGLQPVGSWSSLPNDAQAAAMVKRSSWEPRPQNAKANTTVPTGLALGSHGGVAPIWNDWLLPRVTGNFTGTTDEIIQWAALKWGLPDEALRGQMITESYWYQGLLDSAGQPINGRGFGDFTTDQSKCPPGYTAPCPMSFGVLQIKAAPYHPGVFPWARDSTAFNMDYVGAILRGCYEGWETWLSKYGTADKQYTAGDLYGCMGRWYAGLWYGTDAERYIAKVKTNTTARAWAGSSFRHTARLGVQDPLGASKESRSRPAG